MSCEHQGVSTSASLEGRGWKDFLEEAEAHFDLGIGIRR